TVNQTSLEERVRARDGHRCRWCEFVLGVADGVVYHLCPNRASLADDERQALLLCRSCAEHLAGKVPGYYWRIHGERHFYPPRSTRGVIDTNGRVFFELTS